MPTGCVKFTEPTSARVSPVVAETAHTDGTRVVQYKWDDQKSIKTTKMRMPMDYLEIPEPRLPRVFLDLADEARNVKVDSGRPCYTKKIQPQKNGLTRRVFVTVMVDSSPVLKKGAVRATGVSTEMIQIMDSAGRCEPVDRSGLVGPQSKTEQPVLLGLDADRVENAPVGPVGPDMSSAGRCEPVDRSGLVGPQNKTEQPVLLGLDADQVGNAPAGSVGPDIMMDRIQPVAQGPVGQNDSDRPTDDGPVGRFITHSPVRPDRILSTCDPDRTVADGPVDRLLKLGPVGPKRIFSLDEPNQPVAVGPVGQAFTPGPVGTHVSVADCKRMDRIDDSPVGSTEILDPVNQTGRPIQTDLMKIGTINRPASLGDTPPSSDSGVHSLGEQWENMSTNSMDLESEQNGRPTYGSTMRRRVSDIRVPPYTEEDEDVDYPCI